MINALPVFRQIESKVFTQVNDNRKQTTIESFLTVPIVVLTSLLYSTYLIHIIQFHAFTIYYCVINIFPASEVLSPLSGRIAM